VARAVAGMPAPGARVEDVTGCRPDLPGRRSGCLTTHQTQMGMPTAAISLTRSWVPSRAFSVNRDSPGSPIGALASLDGREQTATADQRGMTTA
jgi:hypothetical protein